jgi:succinate dehydrogenase / fumarate reductase, cytochrome b subunit
MNISPPDSRNNISSLFHSSIVIKSIISVSGLLLLSFTVVHLLGNLLIFSGVKDNINDYAHSLKKLTPFVNLVELFLLVAGIAHVAYATATAFKNSKARPEQYHHIKSAGKPSHQSVFSTTMRYTGGILFFFIVFHIMTFKFGLFSTVPYIINESGISIKDVYQLILMTFQQPFYVSIYIISIIALSFHLQHGFNSAIQSLGISSQNYTKVFGIVSTLISFSIAIGFSSIPICIYLGVIA